MKRLKLWLILPMTIGMLIILIIQTSVYPKGSTHWKKRETPGFVTLYLKGQEATSPYMPELITHYNKQHLPFTDERNMYFRNQESDVLYSSEEIVNYDKQHRPIQD